MSRQGKSQLNRRHFVQGALATPLLGACGTSNKGGFGDGGAPPVDGEPGAETFRHGVASGDPLADRVMLWTRINPETHGDGPHNVQWQLATDPELNDVVMSGSASAAPEQDHTVKVDVDGLEAGTTYYYQFSALGDLSPVGRTKTLPAGSPERARFALVSCASLPHGFFNAYRRIAERPDLDFVLHLGDYIYEYAGPEYSDPDAVAAGREYSEDNRVEIVELADYRGRYANYRLDPDLQEMHRQYAMINIWDDHEMMDNTWRDGGANHQPESEGDFATRIRNAHQAFFEWLPIREQPAGDTDNIVRRFPLGDLAEIITLDTRWAGRSEQADGSGIDISLTEAFRDEGVVAGADRRMIDEAQEATLQDFLQNAAAQWKLVAQQVVFSQWKLTPEPNAANVQNPGGQGGTMLNFDSWDGYPRARDRIWQMIRDGAVDNTVVLTGDVHLSQASDITEDPNNPIALAGGYDPVTGDGAMGVEFVCTSVTSPPEFPDMTEDLFMQANPHIKYFEIGGRGYMLMDIDRQRCQGEWWFVGDHVAPNGAETMDAAWKSTDGNNRVTEGSQSSPRSDPPAPAPPPAEAPADDGAAADETSSGGDGR